VNTKLVVLGLVSVLTLTSCASSNAEAESESTPSKQELAWGHVIEACRLNAEMNWSGGFGSEAALSEMQKAAEIDPIYIEYITAHLAAKSFADMTVRGIDFDRSEFTLQVSKVEALCLTASKS